MAQDERYLTQPATVTVGAPAGVSRATAQSGVREDMPAVHGSPSPRTGLAATEAVRRPTPLDPYPEPQPQEQGGDEKAYPPELGADAIAILEGRTFMYSDSRGRRPNRLGRRTAP
jgi:hypothetical protein